MEEAGIDPKNPALLVDIPGADPFVSHVVLRVTTSSGEIFAVDLAGAQYGWQERFYSWDTYVKHRVESLGDIDPLGTMRTMENALLSMIGADGPARASSAIRKAIVGGVAAHINSFLASQHMSVKEFTSLPKAEFSAAREQLVTRANIFLHTKLQEFMRQGFGRVYFDSSFKTCIASTTATVAKYQKVWLSREEFKAAGGNLDKLRRIWEDKLKIVDQV